MIYTKKLTVNIVCDKQFFYLKLNDETPCKHFQ